MNTDNSREREETLKNLFLSNFNAYTICEQDRKEVTDIPAMTIGRFISVVSELLNAQLPDNRESQPLYRFVKASEKPLIAEVIDLDLLIRYGQKHSDNIIDYVPMSFTYKGHPVTHESKTIRGHTYLVGNECIKCDSNNPVIIYENKVYPYWHCPVILQILYKGEPTMLRIAEGKWSFYKEGMGACVNVQKNQWRDIEWLVQLPSQPITEEKGEKREVLSAEDVFKKFGIDFSISPPNEGYAINATREKLTQVLEYAATQQPLSDAVEFAEWLVNEGFEENHLDIGGFNWYQAANNRYSATEELYQIFKSQPPTKTVKP